MGRNIIFNPSHISFHTFISECAKKLNLLLKYAGFLSRGMESGCKGLHAPDLSGLGGPGPHDSNLGPARCKNKNFVPGLQGFRLWQGGVTACLFEESFCELLLTL